MSRVARRCLNKPGGEPDSVSFVRVKIAVKVHDIEDFGPQYKGDFTSLGPPACIAYSVPLMHAL